MVGRAKPSNGPMAVEVSQPAPCQQAFRITLAPEGVRPMRDVVVQEFQKEAALAGFRKGKAPRELVERHFLDQIREETLRRLTRQVFERVTAERHLKPVGPFEVTRVDFDDLKGLALEARVEVEPEFRLVDYRGIRLVKPAVAISADEIAQAMARLQESVAELVPVGEDKPKEKRLPALDDEFAKDVGFDTLAQLRAHLDAKLREQKTAEQAQALEQGLFEALLARHQFDVPPGLVTKHTARLTRDFQTRLLLTGLPDEQVTAELTKYTEHLHANAMRHVKLAFLLERIAEQEALSVTQDELVARLWNLASRWGKEPGEVRRLLDAQGLWPSVVSSIRRDKTVEFLLSVAHIDEAASVQ